MAFHFLCEDRQGAQEVRKANREAHLAYLADHADRIIAAGPLLDPDGGMIGSVLILDFDTAAEAEAFAAGDPYARAGLFARTTITAWRQVYPKA